MGATTSATLPTAFCIGAKKLHPMLFPLFYKPKVIGILRVLDIPHAQ
jgi:hypothetical protein